MAYIGPYDIYATEYVPLSTQQDQPTEMQASQQLSPIPLIDRSFDGDDDQVPAAQPVGTTSYEQGGESDSAPIASAGYAINLRAEIDQIFERARGEMMNKLYEVEKTRSAGEPHSGADAMAFSDAAGRLRRVLAAIRHAT